MTVKFYIDPGHGGTDPGAIGNGLKEKDITLSVGLRIRELLLSYKDVEVKMSRTTDTYPSLKSRTNEANAWGATFLLSIHVNAGGGGTGGYEDFVYTGASSRSVAYQNVIHSEVMKLIGGVDRGNKKGDLHVLRESHMPAMLTEMAFIDVATDAKRLKDSAFLEKVAQGHLNGLVQAFGLKPKEVVVANVKNDYKGTNYEPSIEKLKATGIMSGYSDDEFGITDNLTRGDFAVVVAKLLTYLGK